MCRGGAAGSDSSMPGQRVLPDWGDDGLQEG